MTLRPGMVDRSDRLSREGLNRIQRKVTAYMAGCVDRAKDPAPYTLKQAHTMRVCTHILMLARALDLSSDIKNISAALALLHDLGRFPQFRRYGTYSDPLSRNHAALGAGEIRRLRLLEGLPRRTRQLLYRAVVLHNREVLPAGLSASLDLQARLLRDADKLDIFKVITDVYTGPENGRPSFITHEYAEDGRLSSELTDALCRLNRISFERVRSLNDLKLFQLSMVFDLNFPAAHAHVLDQGVVPAMIRSMPRAQSLDKVEKILIRYLADRSS